MTTDFPMTHKELAELQAIYEHANTAAGTDGAGNGANPFSSGTKPHTHWESAYQAAMIEGEEECI